jgi:hypothetical protein
MKDAILLLLALTLGIGCSKSDDDWTHCWVLLVGKDLQADELTLELMPATAAVGDPSVWTKTYEYRMKGKRLEWRDKIFRQTFGKDGKVVNTTTHPNHGYVFVGPGEKVQCTQ